MTNQTSEALHIVLQHCMLPNLGWYPNACEQHIHTLRKEILAHQSHIFSQNHAEIHLTPPPSSDIISPYEFIAADEIEKDSSKYLKTMLSLFEQNDHVGALTQNL
jgi:hypothetical protein